MAHGSPKHASLSLTFSIAMRWAGHVARMGESRGTYRVLVEKRERKPFVSPIRRGKDTIKMDHQEVGSGGGGGHGLDCSGSG